LASEINIFDARQAFIFCTVLLTVAIATAGCRVLVVSSRRAYWFFAGIFLLWGFGNLLVLTNPPPLIYFWFYAGATSVLWILYLVSAYHLYKNVFSDYPGIASLGTWTVLTAGASILIVALLSVLSSRSLSYPGLLYTQVTLIDRSLVVGLALFLLLLVSIMSRYPIEVRRNLVVHCVAFSSVLFFQALLSIGDQWTAHHHTAEMNNACSIVSAVVFFLWARLVSRSGDITVMRFRRHLNPALETRLLGQLSSINGILLRAGRK
jgi:hypothetical protein